ncbi:hypothetical protein U9M48_013954 [Paspalum notatum var. saurae]|uniref:Uncharacterized protein n=1 Tax=Paspalum notatum var. saurae TaxID=547442 RepID=A0AAQ3T1H0_PASNO
MNVSKNCVMKETLQFHQNKSESNFTQDFIVTGGKDIPFNGGTAQGDSPRMELLAIGWSGRG